MSQPEPKILANEEQLLQAALSRVQKICKGNGVKLESIRVSSRTISMLTLGASTYLELKPIINEKQVVGKTIVGQQVASREEAQRQVNQAMTGAVHGPAAKALMADLLLRRPDQGFGLKQQALPVDFLKKDYTWHELCPTCRGSARAACSHCHGRRVESCTKCSGRRLMPCPLCRSVGLLQGQKCNRCNGQRFVPCDGCAQSGMMSCRTCNGTGTGKCTACNGTGAKSFILNLSAVAVPYFEYEAKSIPKLAADMIETRGAFLVTDGKIKVSGRIADDKENVLGASYEVTFPYGELEFSIGKKDVKAALFGYKGDLTGLPNILDKMLQGPVTDLEEAAQDIGSVADKIKKATRYRLIAQAFLTASKTSVAKTSAYLLKQYDMGLSVSMAEKIAVLADQATAHITRKPRYYGLAAGLSVVMLLNVLYYLFGLREKIAAFLPAQKFDVILDLPMPVLGGMITAVFIQLSAAKAIRKALGHLFPKGQKGTLIPKAGTSGLWGYAGAVFITLVTIIFFAVPVPYWYRALLDLFF